MPTGGSSGASEPPSTTEPRISDRRRSRLTWRARYVAPWAAAGVIVIGSSALVMMHQPTVAAHPRAQTAFCGLVACAVLRSDAAISRAPTTVPSPIPSPSPRASTSAAAAAPAPDPTPSPTSCPKSHPRQAPTPTDPWSPSPDPTHTCSPPPPDWQPPGDNHSGHHGGGWRGDQSHGGCEDLSQIVMTRTRVLRHAEPQHGRLTPVAPGAGL